MDPSDSPPQGDAEYILNAAHQLRADAAIFTNKLASLAATGNDKQVIILELDNYNESALSECASRVHQPSKSFDEMTEDERVDLLRGAVRYASQLEFFDGVLGEVSCAIKRYLDGIMYVIDIWMKNCVVAEKSDRKVRIFTRAGRGGAGITGSGLEQHGVKLYQKICVSIHEKYGIQCDLSIKDLSGETFHARHLRAKHRAFRFDRGFDLFTSDVSSANRLVRNFVQQESAAEQHLFQLCNSKTAYFRSKSG